MTADASPRSPEPGCRSLTLRARIVLILLAMIAAAVAAYRNPAEAPAVPRSLTEAPLPARPGSGSADATAIFRPTWVSPEGHTISAHSGATCVLPNGEVMAVWFGGSREGAADVALFTARHDPITATWTTPVMAVDRARAQLELGRRVKKLGNAVLFPDRDGTLWLAYVTVAVGGWSGSTLNVKTSRDQGRTWTASRRLTVNPFANISSLVRNKPVYADDGRIGLPIYHEMALTYPQMLWLAPGGDGKPGRHVVRSLLQGGNLIQPTVVPLGGNRAAMMLRDHGPLRRMHTAFSDDNGWNWSKPAPGELPNPDSAVDALRLADGRLLLAYNHAAQGRENLRLAVSADAGRTWIPGPMIEEEAGQEFSYPFLGTDGQGRIHLTYTWKRQRIRHVEFNQAWLDQAIRSAVEVR